MAYTTLRVVHERAGEVSSAVSSVLYNRGDRASTEETRSGSYVYSGDATNFHEWELRTKLRMKGKNAEQYPEAVSRIMEGLRGDAFIIAQECGLEVLWDPGSIQTSTEPGHEVLIAKMKEHVFPLTTHEAKELFRQYCKTSGSLSRQSRESMQQYTSRRRRCWKLFKELDPDIELSEGHRADMLLDLAGLGQNERIMIQASIGNQRDFDKIADALVVQRPRIHVREQ